ncbi:hypothetical protein AciX9_3110 [Granulicella tundricola MP5ACTX9]|uniref:Uncharacterized protein n=1 Tax=Granulicella tundricola (strain ATCC BAA-1859 / DSM 23138 / MP5ACTX9) TaxID=1198114 RepID=E8X0U2_GRATM|nr:hypothetical protein AciX9_3110 [Granulicella tundricola MP5ACTX9]
MCYERNLGITPNFFPLIARSPDVSSAEANMHAILGKSLGHDTRERIQLIGLTPLPILPMKAA